MIVIDPGVGGHLTILSEEIPVAFVAQPVGGFTVALIVKIVGAVLQFQESGGLGAVVFNILILIFFIVIILSLSANLL